MTLLDYMMTIKASVGDFAIEEDHKRKITIIRTAKALTEEQKEAVNRLSYPFDPLFIVMGRI